MGAAANLNITQAAERGFETALNDLSQAPFGLRTLALQVARYAKY
jgi:hypothetical protein